ncbi:uncharacterized protein MCYG_04722 [Microsporum canis CBS 113480]|uniref:Uncharacterized protein n=1 Tax=Arthroderma otae (strain ATCC MYA-4605 / CBS 113480) TaxID=554155 RepID=C5FMT2_ARTOC|nr:uncharacterized protein MCYG_04722 [Microsporum canis CBS 113480]EEQ31903.1 predicted protein [Microsporum canis CBS 113480]
MTLGAWTSFLRFFYTMMHMHAWNAWLPGFFDHAQSGCVSMYEIMRSSHVYEQNNKPSEPQIWESVDATSPPSVSTGMPRSASQIPETIRPPSSRKDETFSNPLSRMS